MNFKVFDGLSLRIKCIKNRMIVSFIIIALGVIIYSIITTSYFQNDIKFGPLDGLIGLSGNVGVLGSYFQSIVIIPSCLFLVISIIDCDNNPMIATRNKSRISSWRKQIRDCFIMTIFITLIVVIMGYLTTGLILGDFNNYFSSEVGVNFSLIQGNVEVLNQLRVFNTIEIISITSISLIIGLNFISVLSATLKVFLANKYIAAIIIALSIYETVSEKLVFITKYTTLNINNWLNPSSVLVSNIFMISITVIIYFIGGYLINKKDFINKL